jgi:hypothetical protein
MQRSKSDISSALRRSSHTFSFDGAALAASSSGQGHHGAGAGAGSGSQLPDGGPTITKAHSDVHGLLQQQQQQAKRQPLRLMQQGASASASAADTGAESAGTTGPLLRAFCLAHLRVRFARSCRWRARDSRPAERRGAPRQEAAAHQSVRRSRFDTVVLPAFTHALLCGPCVIVVGYGSSVTPRPRAQNLQGRLAGSCLVMLLWRSALQIGLLLGQPSEPADGLMMCCIAVGPAVWLCTGGAATPTMWASGLGCGAGGGQVMTPRSGVDVDAIAKHECRLPVCVILRFCHVACSR